MFIDRLIEATETVYHFMQFKVFKKNGLNGVYDKVTQSNTLSSDSSRHVLNQKSENIPKVSLITLTYHGAGVLENMLSSFQRHNTWPDVELIIVNHGNDLETKLCLEKWSKILPIREIRLERNFSFAFSCNRAAEIALGEYLIFLNNDIEFTQDIIARIVGALENKAKLVGIKLYDPSEGDKLNYHHIGVRFHWNDRQVWSSPYNAVPTYTDSQIKDEPTAMPAITAAVAACRLSDFLEIGGFHEGYCYAYEDVDLCLKFSQKFPDQLYSLNDISALHREGETRKKKSSLRKRKIWQMYNSTLFKKRFGFLSRKNLYHSLFKNRRDFLGHDFMIGLCPLKSGTAFPEKPQVCLPIVSTHHENLTGYNLFAIDLLILENPNFNLTRARHLRAAMIKMAYVTKLSKWHLEHFDQMDIICAPTRTLADDIQAMIDRPVHILPFESDKFEPLIRDILLNFHQKCQKISVKLGKGEAQKFSVLKSVFERKGHIVRLDEPPDHYGKLSLRDDVVLWCAKPVNNQVQHSSVNIALFDLKPEEIGFFDAYCLFQFEGDLDRLSHLIETCVKQRMQPVVDASLHHRPGLSYEDQLARWFEKDDPVRPYLDMS